MKGPQLGDDFYDHPKMVRVSAGALVLWIASVGYCARHQTDGYIPRNAVLGLARVTDPQPFVDELLEAIPPYGPLWERNADGSYRVHDFLDHNPSREAQVARRDAAKRRKDEWKRRRAANAVVPSGERADASPPARSKPPASSRRSGERVPAPADGARPQGGAQPSVRVPVVAIAPTEREEAAQVERVPVAAVAPTEPVEAAQVERVPVVAVAPTEPVEAAPVERVPASTSWRRGVEASPQPAQAGPAQPPAPAPPAEHVPAASAARSASAPTARDTRTGLARVHDAGARVRSGSGSRSHTGVCVDPDQDQDQRASAHEAPRERGAAEGKPERAANGNAAAAGAGGDAAAPQVDPDALAAVGGDPDAAAVLMHLRALPEPMRSLATPEYASRFAGARMNGLGLHEVRTAITNASLKLGAHRRANPDDPEAIDALADHVGTFLGNQRRLTARLEPRSLRGVEPVDVERFLRKWCDAYQRDKDVAYTVTDEDRSYAAELLELIRQAATAEVVRTGREDESLEDRLTEHWIRSFLDDEGPAGYLVKTRHSLRYMKRQVATYGLPAARKLAKRAPSAPAEEVATNEQNAAGARATLAAMSAGFGFGGSFAPDNTPTPGKR
jgi:hypothetical protein